MKHCTVGSVADIGQVVCAVRKTHGIRQDDLAGSAGVSHVYLRDLEYGKDTVQMGRALKVLEELGVRVTVEIPDDVHERLAAMREKTALLPAESAARSPQSAEVRRK